MATMCTLALTPHKVDMYEMGEFLDKFEIPMASATRVGKLTERKLLIGRPLNAINYEVYVVDTRTQQRTRVLVTENIALAVQTYNDLG